MPEIDIIIHEDGTVEIDGIGFNGKGCHEALGEYIKAVGRKKTENRKAEFYHKTQKIGQSTRIGGGNP